MKKYFIIIFLVFLFCMPAFAYPYIRTNYEYILGTKYTCYYNDCYDLNSFYYNKLTKIYTINMVIDLMNWNQHEKYPSPHGKGYITHLIFKTDTHNDKITVKCIGYITGKIIPQYNQNERIATFHYHFFKEYEGIPPTIKDLTSLEENLRTWINKDIYNRKIKTLADI